MCNAATDGERKCACGGCSECRCYRGHSDRVQLRRVGTWSHREQLRDLENVLRFALTFRATALTVPQESARARAKFDGKPFPKNATPYPGIGQMVMGHPSSTTATGIVIGATVFGVTAVATRGLVFGPLHRSLAKKVMVDPATGFQKRIGSLPAFVASLAPGVRQ